MLQRKAGQFPDVSRGRPWKSGLDADALPGQITLQRMLMIIPLPRCAVRKSRRSRALIDRSVISDSGCGAKPKTPTSGSSQGLEVPMVQREHIKNSVAFGKNDDRGVGKADAEVAIAAENCRG